MIDAIKENIELFLSTVILIFATIYFVIQKNYEFLIYAGTLIILIGILYRTDKTFHYMKAAKWGFLAWMVMHMAGGTLYIQGTRLYDVILLPIFGSPFDVLKYDQFVHFFCYVVITLLMYSIFKTIAKKDYNRMVFTVILVLAGSSVGALNEIIEFSAVVMFDSNGVGGYYNTAIDLIANLLGSIVAAAYLYFDIKI